MILNSNAPVINEPSSKTQVDTVRAHLMTGASITTWEAYRLYQITCLAQRIGVQFNIIVASYQITCLAQRIHDLRTAGLVIQSEMVTHDGKRFAVYWLDEATLLEAQLSNDEVTP